jgi:hypothetical protein
MQRGGGVSLDVRRGFFAYNAFYGAITVGFKNIKF